MDLACAGSEVIGGEGIPILENGYKPGYSFCSLC